MSSKRVSMHAHRAAKDLGKNKGTTMTMHLATLIPRLHRDEEGQGLVEYMLILLLVAFGATAGMSSLASYMNVAFSNIGILLNQYIP
jgi:pilus assembly protein Flp/PilA